MTMEWNVRIECDENDEWERGPKKAPLYTFSVDTNIDCPTYQIPDYPL